MRSWNDAGDQSRPGSKWDAFRSLADVAINVTLAVVVARWSPCKSPGGRGSSSMLKDGTYAAWFKTPQREGTGIVHIADGQIWGRDGVMTYSGSLERDGDR